MKEVKSIDRSFQNQKNEVIETDVPKSGFNMTYRNHLGGLVLGRLYPQSIQHLMPNDKISGSNEASITFEQLSTPVVDTMDVCVHNFLVTLRSIDNRWENFMTPTKLNNMNANVSVPTFDLKKILSTVALVISRVCFLTYDTENDNALTNVLSVSPYRLRTDSYAGVWDYVYHTDAIFDLIDQLNSILGSRLLETSATLDLENNDDRSVFYEIVCSIIDFFVGKRSLLDYLGYVMIDRSKVIETLDSLFTNLPADLEDIDTLWSWFMQDDVETNLFTENYVLQNEYALRAYYAIWFEYYRNYDLEPRSATLPEYHDFGGTSIFDNYSLKYLHYLVPRIRSWQQDAFTTAGIDDISRHVFAPLLTDMSESDFIISNRLDTSLQPAGILDNNTVSQVITWRNPATGTVSSIDVPMPSRLLSAFTSNTETDLNGSALELFSLRKAQMLENYLKRIYYGGDEYRDRMLHLYGARIEDYRINRPQWLSSSLDNVDPKQEVANTGVAPGSPSGWSAGSRLATATAVQSGNDGFTEFCPEFGVYISILSIMPHGTYDPMLLQNLQTKYTDFPIPQFANQLEDVISSVEISRRVPHSSFGYAPYAHAYRYRVDEVHGDYHDSKFDYIFYRFFDAGSVPNLSWSFLHCRPKLPMFVDSVLLDGQAYGTFKHNFFVERPLPSPVETI